MAENSSERPSSTALIRTIGRWSLTALVINSIIGSGIFGLPSVVSGRVGQMAPVAYLVAGAGMAVIAGCLAEVASQFRETGGPYLYARETLGRFWGIQIAWMTWLSRIAAGSGTANLFTTYLGQVFPRATEPAYRFAILSALVGLLAVVNYVGVKSGASASDFFTTLKLLLLAAFIGVGLWWVAVHGGVTPVPLAHVVEPRDWLEATLVLVYAYGGFEAVLLASGEMRDPRHDVPIALMIGIATVAVIYMLVQIVVSGTLPNPGATQRPLADSAAAMLGPGAAAAIAIGALFSIYGYLSANMLHTPRLTFALAERGDIPAIFARIHPQFRNAVRFDRTVYGVPPGIHADGKFSLEHHAFGDRASVYIRLKSHRIAADAEAKSWCGCVSTPRWAGAGGCGDPVLPRATRTSAVEQYNRRRGDRSRCGAELGAGAEANCCGIRN